MLKEEYYLASGLRKHIITRSGILPVCPISGEPVAVAAEGSARPPRRHHECSAHAPKVSFMSRSAARKFQTSSKCKRKPLLIITS